MILAIIQARMSSTRLPGKVLMDLAGKPMLQWVIDAVEASTLVDHVIVATSTMASDNRICEYLKDGYFRGSLEDVLDRYYRAAISSYVFPAHIIRITADCPLTSSKLIDKVIEQHIRDRNDYTTNGADWPSGFDVEVFTFGTLLEAAKLAKDPYQREHVTPYMQDPNRFKIGYYGGGPGRTVKWSVDTKEDFERIAQILGAG